GGVGRYVADRLVSPRVPFDDDRIYPACFAQTEMRVARSGRQVASVRVVIVCLDLAGIVIDRGDGPDAVDILFAAFEFDIQKMIRIVIRSAGIAIDQGFIVDIVDDEVERTVIVEIGDGRAIGEGGEPEAPGPGDVIEG